jgi:DNA-binding NtrC family response regulator
MSARILIVDDEPNIRTTLRRALDLEGFDVLLAEDADSGVAAVIEGTPDLVLLDLKLPDRDGLWVIQQLQQLAEPPAVVMMTGHGSTDAAVEAMKLGALDFLEKPLAVDRLLVTIRNALRLDALDREVEVLRRSAEIRHGMVGGSPELSRVVQLVRQAAPTKLRVLVTGESGVGKELVARAIHECSRRATRRFVALNCAAFAENLVESELFGHERGAFSGADRRREGRFQQADHGTLFLDEIGEMPLSIQAKLLRVLEEREVMPLGAARAVSVDVRVIAATNRDLQEEVAEGRFRLDLLQRLDGIVIHVPPLRARRGDIPALAVHLLDAFCRDNEFAPKDFSDAGLRALQGYGWPGNVRQLSNRVGRLATMTPGDLIDAPDVRRALQDVPRFEGSQLPSEGPLYGILEALERRIIEDRIARFEGNMTRAADDLGLERSHLYKKIKKLGITR